MNAGMTKAVWQLAQAHCEVRSRQIPDPRDKPEDDAVGQVQMKRPMAWSKTFQHIWVPASAGRTVEVSRRHYSTHNVTPAQAGGPGASDNLRQMRS